MVVWPLCCGAALLLQTQGTLLGHTRSWRKKIMLTFQRIKWWNLQPLWLKGLMGSSSKTMTRSTHPNTSSSKTNVGRVIYVCSCFNQEYQLNVLIKLISFFSFRNNHKEGYRHIHIEGYVQFYNPAWNQTNPQNFDCNYTNTATS